MSVLQVTHTPLHLLFGLTNLFSVAEQDSLSPNTIADYYKCALNTITTMIESIFNFSFATTTKSASRNVRELTEHERLSTLALHLDADDYFRSLSTLLGFIEDALATGDRDLATILLDAVPAARKDLGYLHDNYHIKPRHQTL